MIVHALALALSAALVTWVASRVARRPSVATAPFIWFSAAIAVWTLAGAGHALSGDLSAKLLWAKVQYFGIASVPPLYLLLTAEYAGVSWFAGRGSRLLLWMLPVATIAAAVTSQWHQALWTSVTLGPDGVAEYAHGWLFWLAAGYNYLLVLTGTVLVGRTLRAAPPFRSQFVPLLLAALVPWAANALYLSGVGIGPIADVTPLGFTASYLLFAWALYRHHLFDVLPVARDIIVDSLTDAVVVIDGSARLVDLNAAARDLARAHAPTREAVTWLGRPLPDVFSMLEGIPLDTTSLSVTSPVLTTDGVPSIFDVRVMPVRSRRGTLSAWALVLRDVTVQRRAAEERQAMRERMQEQQRRESLSILAGGLAHDFNNLLASIIGNADLLAMQAPASSAMGSSVSSILLGAQRAADLVSKMLAYAGERHGSLARIDLDVVTRDLLELLRASAARHCTVAYEGRPGLIYADPTQVRQVAMNLIINAAEAVRDEGVVTVATGVETLAREDLASARFGQDAAPGEYAFLDVRDTGAGMDVRTLQRIFDPFFTTKADGHGLGLAVVQGIVLGHRGALRVESVEGQGSCFRVWFPVATDQNSDPFGPFNQVELRDRLTAL